MNKLLTNFGFMRKVQNTETAGEEMSTESKVKDYILENYLFTDDQNALGSDDSFLDKGIIDSTGIMEVIFFLETEFGIQVDDEEMVPENLDSVNSITAYIERKKVVS